MKKYYSVLAAFCAVAAINAQGNGNNGSPTPSTSTSQSVMTAGQGETRTDAVGSTRTAIVTGNKPVLRRGNVNYTSQIRIGSSWYDLQTNAAMPHRLILHSDGSVSA